MSRNRPTSTRYSDRVSFAFLVWMVTFAVLASAGGVTYSVLKNCQVAERTEINKLHREIAVCNMNANQHRARTNALTNRWAMRDRLSQDGSALRDIERSQIEIARTAREQGRLTMTSTSRR